MRCTPSLPMSVAGSTKQPASAPNLDSASPDEEFMGLDLMIAAWMASHGTCPRSNFSFEPGKSHIGDLIHTSRHILETYAYILLSFA